ncbi:MAG: spermidine synthase [Candidatus Nanopelagicales bacterium]
MTRPRFEELDWQNSALGEIVLRRRVEPTLDIDVYEVKLGEEFLMSSLFTVAEVELSRLGLAEVSADRIDVLVGGLGLGYTAVAALEDPRVKTLTVVEAVGPVISWHQRQLLPDTAGLTSDPRARLHEGDFFAIVREGGGLPDDLPAKFDAILLDIDHTPKHVLNPSHSSFYTSSGLESLRRFLKPSGVFALWSDDPPDEEFMATLAGAFTNQSAHVVNFPNPLTSGTSSNTVYVAHS